jgi:hypothetical protein
MWGAWVAKWPTSPPGVCVIGPIEALPEEKWATPHIYVFMTELSLTS